VVETWRADVSLAEKSIAEKCFDKAEEPKLQSMLTLLFYDSTRSFQIAFGEIDHRQSETASCIGQHGRAGRAFVIC
jgi:hypothetical protein